MCLGTGKGIRASNFNSEDWTSILPDPRFKIQDPGETLCWNLGSCIREYGSSILGIELQYFGLNSNSLALPMLNVADCVPA